jgi:hypothetical protein
MKMSIEELFESAKETVEKTSTIVALAVGSTLQRPSEAVGGVLGAFMGLDQLCVTVKDAMRELEGEGRANNSSRAIKHLIQGLFHERAMMLAELAIVDDNRVEATHSRLQSEFGKRMKPWLDEAEAMGLGKPLPPRVTH